MLSWFRSCCAGVTLQLVVSAVCLSADRPNLLVILADDLGYADLACCGSKDMQTPHIDGLFASGMQFTHFYANCPVCSPTRAALLSGRYQELVGVPGVIRTHPENSWGYLDPKAVLLPELARRNGYHTAIVGKWHLGLESPNTPTERGFDHFHGFLGDMMDDYYNHRRHGNNYMFLNKKEIDPKGHATDLFTQWAVEYLNDQRNSDQPFLLYLAYNAPHTPIQPPDNWLEKVKQREPDIKEYRAKLVALIEHMDHGVGKVLETLQANGQARNTIVVFSSDNGGDLPPGANNGPLRDGKQSVYEGGLRVPTAVVWPGQIQAGSRSEFRAMSMDILPTLFEAAGIHSDMMIDGRSFLPTILGRDQEELRQQWFFCRREGGLRYGGKSIEAVIEGPWKLLQNSPFEPLELYNLKADPFETTNLAAKNPKMVNQLNAALRLQLQRGGRVPWQGQHP
ncbi:MAG: sulfatase-like hydrolase/transferase [Planctomycetaceae bacterium]|nr:sulfatase-like hydrolase/transferase [Planctomycetaceae bacterium]